MEFPFTTYQLAVATGVLLLFLIFRNIILKLLFKLARKFTQKTQTHLDDDILNTVEKPLKTAILVIGIYAALSVAAINIDLVYNILKTLVIIIIFWTLYNAIDVFKRYIQASIQKANFELATEISELFIKVIRFFVIAVGAVAVLEQWSIDISTFVASLGIGGLAFALAAKDTVANFFGGIMIFADRSLRIGDWIKGGGVEGIVEEINIRSTKIRTFEHSLITVPNASLANGPIENYSRRGIRRINMRIGLTYSTSLHQMQTIVAQMRTMLSERKDIDDETIFIYFDQFGASSLDIFCYFFTATANWQEYLAIREDVNFEIIKIVQDNGASFAFPSQSVYFENELPLQNTQGQIQEGIAK